MTDLQVLLLALTVVYGWECACWIRRGGVVFLSRWGGCWRVAVPGALLGNHQGGFLFGYPFPPLGWIVTGVQAQLSISPRGVLAFVPPPVDPEWRAPQTGEFVAFADMSSVNAKGKTLRVNGKVLLRTGSVQRAQQLEAQLRRLRDLPAGRREGVLRTLSRRAVAVRPVRRRWREFLKQTRSIRLWCNLLFVYLFVAMPALIWFVGLRRIWLPMVLGLFLCSALIAIRSLRVHRVLYPEASDERFTLVLTLLLSPPTAIRACDALSRPLLMEYDPVALARVLLSEERFEVCARDALLALRYPILPDWSGDQAAHRETERFGRALRLEVLEERLRKEGYDPAGLRAVPVRGEGSAVAYCPRCGAQFARETGGCGDCGGVGLLALS